MVIFFKANFSNSFEFPKAVRPKPGDANPCLAKLWEEIRALDALIDAFESGVDSNPAAFYSTMMESQSSTLETVKTLLSQPSIPNWKKGLGRWSHLSNNKNTSNK